MNNLEKILERILKCTLGGMGRIPRHISKGLAIFLGKVWFSLDKKHQSITIDNLSRAYGGKLSPGQCRQLAETVFANTVQMIFEYAWFYASQERERSSCFKVRGMAHLRKAHAKGKGVLILTGHMGNWELLLALVPLSGYPASVVYRPIKSEPIDRVVRENRNSIGVSLHPLHNAFEGVRKGLEKGELIGLLMDQNTGHHRGVFVEFFNRKACANPGLAKLALDTGAPVLPVFIFRENNRFIIEVQPELKVIRTGDREKDIVENTQLHNATIEKVVRRYPEQWFWLHKRWKTRPLDGA